jgi:hypothetical protein
MAAAAVDHAVAFNYQRSYNVIIGEQKDAI